MDTEEKPQKIVFKKRRCLGNRRVTNVSKSEEDLPDESSRKVSDPESVDKEDDDSINWKTLDQLRELQKHKKRVTKGINVLDLVGDSKKTETKNIPEKPIGGLADSKTLASELDLGNTFSLETNRRDEDAELMRYVEDELKKRRATSETDPIHNNALTNKLDPTRDLLAKVIPENLLNLISETKTKNEEMLSSQMLSGIPEIDLGVEERIRNIEKTEEARTKLLEKRFKQRIEQNGEKAKTDMSFAPKNLASCFSNRQLLNTAGVNTNHRFNLSSVPNENKDLIAHFIDEEGKVNRLRPNVNKVPEEQAFNIEPVVVIGAEPQKVRLPKPVDKDKMPAKDKPTDNYIFEKFRKQLKKH